MIELCVVFMEDLHGGDDVMRIGVILRTEGLLS